MEASTTHEKKTRIDTRLSKEQKLLFEKAATLGGYRSLTDFILVTAQEKATKVIQERETILVSQRDNEIFFDALVNAGEPNEVLISAADEYKKLLATKCK